MSSGDYLREIIFKEGNCLGVRYSGDYLREIIFKDMT